MIFGVLLGPISLPRLFVFPRIIFGFIVGKTLNKISKKTIHLKYFRGWFFYVEFA
jgi:hypothetical protein